MRNVVPFGAFVDVGVGVSAWFTSRTCAVKTKGGGRSRTRCSAGQAVRVRVMSVDAQRTRIGLALVS